MKSKNWSLLIEISLRLLKSKGSALVSFSGWISLIGLMLGVACLVVSMAVMSGFERTLQKNVSDVSGDLQIYFTPRSGLDIEESLLNEIPGHEAHSGFLASEAILAHQGRIRGILLQGLDYSVLPSVLNLESRIIEGSFPGAAATDSPADQSPAEDSVMIGKGIARELNLRPGDTFQVVVLLAGELDVGKFRRKIGEFKVAGILDLGKYEYDQRMVVMHLPKLQGLIEVNQKLSGYLVRLDGPERALQVAPQLADLLGNGHRVRTWKDVNENIFEAVVIERMIVFFVILVIVFAASFNVMSSLLVNVYQRFHDIALLRALGFRKVWIMRIFQIQGMVIGVIGSLAGLALGIILALSFEWVEKRFGLVPGSVYKIDSIAVQFRWQDLVSILVATNLIALGATWLPAKKGAELLPVEGLRYE